jgi:RNA polymerase sigma-70 factor, ECF subfamily
MRDEDDMIAAAALPDAGSGPALPPGEDAIARAIAAGDHREALVACARRYGQAIGRYCHAMLGSQADADDVAQETLLAAHDGFAGWRAEGSLQAWLFSIARRKCARLAEQRARRTARLRLVHDAAKPDSGGGERQLLDRERAERARHLLAQIKPSEREALLLRYEAGLSYREVGEACGIDEAAARKRVSRALAAMRAALEVEGSES